MMRSGWRVARVVAAQASAVSASMPKASGEGSLAVSGPWPSAARWSTQVTSAMPSVMPIARAVLIRPPSVAAEPSGADRMIAALLAGMNISRPTPVRASSTTASEVPGAAPGD
jgi:hypothetical protein